MLDALIDAPVGIEEHRRDVGGGDLVGGIMDHDSRLRVGVCAAPRGHRLLSPACAQGGGISLPEDREGSLRRSLQPPSDAAAMELTVSRVVQRACASARKFTSAAR